MTHAELTERILDDFKKDWDKNPSAEPNIKAFRLGVLTAYDYLLTVLKNGNASFYEEEDYSGLCYHDKKEIENMVNSKRKEK